MMRFESCSSAKIAILIFTTEASVKAAFCFCGASAVEVARVVTTLVGHDQHSRKPNSSEEKNPKFYQPKKMNTFFIFYF